MTYQQAEDFFGGPRELADAVGASPQAISNWKNVHKRVPKLRQYQLYVLTDGALRMDENIREMRGR